MQFFHLILQGEKAIAKAIALGQSGVGEKLH